MPNPPGLEIIGFQTWGGPDAKDIATCCGDLGICIFGESRVQRGIHTHTHIYIYIIYIYKSVYIYMYNGFTTTHTCMHVCIHTDRHTYRWRIYGGFMMDLWRIYGGFMEDVWRIYGGFMKDLWMIYGWFMDKFSEFWCLNLECRQKPLKTNEKTGIPQKNNRNTKENQWTKTMISQEQHMKIIENQRKNYEHIKERPITMESQQQFCQHSKLLYF